jgi:hypothetical protein
VNALLNDSEERRARVAAAIRAVIALVRNFAPGREPALDDLPRGVRADVSALARSNDGSALLKLGRRVLKDDDWKADIAFGAWLALGKNRQTTLDKIEAVRALVLGPVSRRLTSGGPNAARVSV